ncbi:cytoskeleton-associated protein 2-like [Lacerta agilis]|uniref:cytoskeleton-associated protein 2-like n=1 Tax=Lacerta agilis TaxID=80427 RepID=UPI0014197F33|nr:cytoskeleton-associated protein 2-like [Lacerta agilis]
MARVPDMLLRDISEEEMEMEFSFSNEISFYESVQRADILCVLEDAASKPGMQPPRRRRPSRSRLFTDADLGEMLSTNLVGGPSSFAEASLVSSGLPSTYTYVKVQRWNIQDLDNKCFFLDGTPGQPKLFALHIQANDKPVQLDLRFYRSLLGSDAKSGQLVALDIVDSKLYLTCIKEGDGCHLQLEEAEKPLSEISGDNQKFLFYYKPTSKTSTTFTFQSLVCPGWYVATPKDSGYGLKERGIGRSQSQKNMISPGRNPLMEQLSREGGVPLSLDGAMRLPDLYLGPNFDRGTGVGWGSPGIGGASEDFSCLSLSISPAAAAVEERRQKLQEYLAAKGRLRPPSTKPYLKDNSRQKNPAPSKAQPTVGSRKNIAPSTAKSASTREAKGSGPASKVLPDKPPRALVHREPNNAPTQLPRKGGPLLPLPSKPPARKHPEKLISRSSSAGHCLGRTREPGKQVLATASGTSNVLSGSSKAERDKENSGLKQVGQPRKRETSRFSLQAKFQVGSKPPVKNAKQAVGNSTLSKNHRAAAAQVKPRAPLGGPQGQVHCNTVAPTSPPRGRPSAVSRPGVGGQNPRLIKQPAGLPVPRGSLAGREEKASSSSLGILQRGRSRPQAGALQERTLPSHYGALQRKRKATPERRRPAAPGGTKQNRSPAGREPGSKKFKQSPRTSEPKSRHRASEQGSGGRGRAKQPARETGQESKTPGTRDRRKLLEEWLASKGKRYKRPPVTFPVKRRPPPKEQAALNRSFWDCIEEEMEQQKVAQEIASTLAECAKLADEGVPSEELLAMLSHIPEAEKFARFWACKAKLLARQGPFDAAGLYRAAASAGAVPLRELRDALVDTLKHSSQAWGKQWIRPRAHLVQHPVLTVASQMPLGTLDLVTPFSIPKVAMGCLIHACFPSAEAAPCSSEFSKQCSSRKLSTPAELRLPGKEQVQSNGQGPVCQPLSAIKLQVASLPRAKEPSARPGLKLLTPVRRSLRIERASARYPQMLRDHDPVVSCLDEIMDAEDGCGFIFRKNEALPETVEVEGFLPQTLEPTSPAPSVRRPLFC